VTSPPRFTDGTHRAPSASTSVFALYALEEQKPGGI